MDVAIHQVLTSLTTLSELSIRKQRCTEMDHWVRHCWSATHAGQEMSLYSDLSLQRLTLLWCYCVGKINGYLKNETDLFRIYVDVKVLRYAIQCCAV